MKLLASLVGAASIGFFLLPAVLLGLVAALGKYEPGSRCGRKTTRHPANAVLSPSTLNCERMRELDRVAL